MRVEHRTLLDHLLGGRPGGTIGGVQLQQVEGTGVATAGGRIDEDRRVPALEELVSQVQSADAEVGHLHLLRHSVIRHSADHLDAEAVVPEEDVAHPGHQHPQRRGHDAASSGTTSSGEK